jgi:hypothetical protein
MNLDLAKKVADSVLYEGYLLYPYRASAVKNRQRFNFGVLLPPAYARAQTGHDAWSMRTECLLEGEAPRVDVRIRFLQVVVREAGRLLEPHETGRRETDPFEDSHQSHPYEIVSELVVNGNVYQTWQEAVERSKSVGTVRRPTKRKFCVTRRGEAPEFSSAIAHSSIAQSLSASRRWENVSGGSPSRLRIKRRATVL